VPQGCEHGARRRTIHGACRERGGLSGTSIGDAEHATPKPKVNLGCGRNPIRGFVNADFRQGPGVDVIADVSRLPFTTGSLGMVYASHVLEHVVHLDDAMREIHRVLRPGGLLVARVPYGLRYLYDPFHFHAFSKRTMLAFTQSNMGLQSGTLFQLLDQRITDWNMPFRWHMRKHMPRLYSLISHSNEDGKDRLRFPLGRSMELTVRLRKVADG